MGGIIVLPGPEIAVLFGVHVHVLSALFGLGGIVLGHVIAPVATQPIGRRRQAGVVAAGMVVALGLAIAAGQRPLLVFGWSIGLGFSGIVIFQTAGAQAAAGVRIMGQAIIDRIAGRAAGREDHTS